MVLEETSSFFYVYMSKCRQFEGFSTGMVILYYIFVVVVCMVILTIPNHTIKLQLHRRGTPHHSKKKIHKKKYLSIQLLIRGTCRVATEGQNQ